jgi:flagellar motor switch protein FliM
VFGSVGNEPAFADPRPFSKIERSVMRLLFKVIGRALPAAFPNITLKEFFIAPPQDPHEDPLYPVFKPFVSVRILCNIHGYSGEVLIEMPEELTTLFRPLDEEKHPMAAPAVSEWGSQISSRVESIEVELVVVLAELQMSLDIITSFQTGQLIRLESDISSPVAVCSEGVKLFNAKLGQTDKKFCLSLQAPVNQLN